MSKTFVIGHTSPDTDSVVSSMAYAQLKNASDAKNAFEALIPGELNQETRYVFERFKVNAPHKVTRQAIKDHEVILVDHNEPSQMAPGIRPGQIAEIIDHHRLSPISTAEPIAIRMEPVGSTSTVITHLYHDYGKRLTKQIAALLLSAIISDTAGLTSPVTTDSDREAARFLARVYGLIDVEELTTSIFEARSNTKNLTDRQLLLSDYKEFELGEDLIGISVVETVRPEEIMARKEGLMSALSKKKVHANLDFSFLLIGHILGKKSALLAPTRKDEALAERAFNKKAKDGFILVPGVISRKKQLIPAITEALER